jgi:2-oxoglutarate ferredoxin oxidoreductase subunit alpha
MAQAFEIAERYRTPVIVLTDGLMGQAMEPVDGTFRHVPRTEADWALTGAVKRAPRVIKSVSLGPAGLEEHNLHLQQKFAQIAANEVRWAGEDLEDAEYLMVAYGTAARICEDVLLEARERGLRVGLLRPITLWPFPDHELAALAARVKGMLVVELSAGQMLDDVRLAVEGRCPVEFHGRMGGVLPGPHEILAVLEGMADPSHDAFGPDPASLVYADPVGRSGTDEEPDPTSLVEVGAWWVLTHGGSTR